MAARRLLVSVGVASVLAGGAVGSAHSSALCGGTPSLRLVDSDPVALEGAGFCAGERLRVRARAGDARRSRRLRADDAGGFSVRFGSLDYDRCAGSLNASAWSFGDLRARLKRARKLCPVPLPPGDAAPSRTHPSGSGPDSCSATAATGAKPGPRRQCPPT